MTLPVPCSSTSVELVERLFRATIGMFELFSVDRGDRLGIYDAMADGESTTAPALARRTNTNTRYVREWLEHQAASGLLTVDDVAATPESRKYQLTSEHAVVRANRDHVAFSAPIGSQVVGIAQLLEELVDAYRAGEGVPFDQYGPDIRGGIAGANRVLFINQLASEWFPALPDISARLHANPPARIGDLGCGSGWSSIALGHAFPIVHVDGLVLDSASITDARTNASAVGIRDRVHFSVQDASGSALHGIYDFVCAFECTHDTAQSISALRAMRNLVGAGGSVLIGDERVAETFQARGDELERVMYGFNILH